ncbi:MAG: hypothetical protein J5J06_13455 [Phycisphaerae bacterium]|nr:hypothetical protein [Phycisphaerae bacterium]
MTLIAGILVALLAVLLVIGLRGRMVDDDPRCSRCRYNLTSLTGERCPECGTAIGVKTVRFRRRARNRPALISAAVVASMLVLGGGALSGARALKLNWYPYCPLDWVLYAARESRAAGEELSRRVRFEMLSPEELDKVVRTAMARQTETYPQEVPEVWANVLGMLEVAGRLSEEDREAFLGSLVWAEVKVRERVRVWEPLVLELHSRSRSSRSVQYQPRVEIANLKGGRGVWSIAPPFASRFLGLTFKLPWDNSAKYEATTFRKGKHVVRGDLRIRLTDPTRMKRIADPDSGMSWRLDDGSADVYQKSVPFELPYEVFPSDAPDPVRRIDQPELTRRIRRDIKAEFRKSEGPKPNLVSRICFDLTQKRPSEIDLGFDVFLQIDAELIPAGEVLWPKGRVNGIFLASKFFAPRKVNRFDVILRSSRDVAIHTVDCYDIWDGEIVIRDVPVR